MTGHVTSNDDAQRATHRAVSADAAAGQTAGDDPTVVVGESIVELAGQLADLTARLGACSVTDLVEPQASGVHRQLRRAGDAVQIVAAKVLARVQADGRWATTGSGRGARTMEDWLAQDGQASRSGARRQTELARAVDGDVPGLADAVAAGTVTMEHAQTLARLAPTSPARREALRGDDASRNADYLLARAAELPADEFTKEVKRWAATQDPSADERGHREATAKTYCTSSERDDGWAIAGFLPPVDGAAFNEALKALVGVPAADDVRTPMQRNGAALGQMARIVLDHGVAGRSGGFRPHVSVHVGLDSLVAQLNALESTDAARSGARGAAAFPIVPPGWEPAVLADGTPIPASVLARLACDSEVSRVVFGPDSQVLDVGRAERLYTGAMRRAVVARDKHCVYPGCFQPPKLSEVHHVRHWAAHGGETSVANGCLLCWWHHDVIHTRHLRIHRNHTRGRWDFTEADGTPIAHPGDRITGQPTRGAPPGGAGSCTGNAREATVGAGATSGPPTRGPGGPPARDGTGGPAGRDATSRPGRARRNRTTGRARRDRTTGRARRRRRRAT